LASFFGLPLTGVGFKASASAFLAAFAARAFFNYSILCSVVNVIVSILFYIEKKKYIVSIQ